MKKPSKSQPNRKPTPEEVEAFLKSMDAETLKALAIETGGASWNEADITVTTEKKDADLTMVSATSCQPPIGFHMTATAIPNNVCDGIREIAAAKEHHIHSLCAWLEMLRRQTETA